MNKNIRPSKHFLAPQIVQRNSKKTEKYYDNFSQHLSPYYLVVCFHLSVRGLMLGINILFVVFTLITLRQLTYLDCKFVSIKRE